LTTEPASSQKPESLDEIVSHHSALLVGQIQQAAASAKSEMDLQVELASALKIFAQRAQVTLEGHHNVILASGRPDSVYGSVIVECKEPGVLSSNKDSSGNRKIIEQILRCMMTKLDEYSPGTFSEGPVPSRDLLKKFYPQLFPKSVRRDLGEYYTPDWLAEHVLKKFGYEGDPDKRILDPACGSGTFLVMAIKSHSPLVRPQSGKARL
jgi:N-6 DNA methylase